MLVYIITTSRKNSDLNVILTFELLTDLLFPQCPVITSAPRTATLYSYRDRLSLQPHGQRHYILIDSSTDGDKRILTCY